MNEFSNAIITLRVEREHIIHSDEELGKQMALTYLPDTISTGLGEVSITYRADTIRAMSNLVHDGRMNMLVSALQGQVSLMGYGDDPVLIWFTDDRPVYKVAYRERHGEHVRDDVLFFETSPHIHVSQQVHNHFIDWRFGVDCLTTSRTYEYQTGSYS